MVQFMFKRWIRHLLVYVLALFLNACGGGGSSVTAPTTVATPGWEVTFESKAILLTDPRDEFILELAVAAGCEAIVTHNVRDFAGAARFAVNIITPGAFLASLEEEA